MIYGLLLSTKILDAIAHRPISFSLHQDLAAIGLGLAAIHGTLLGLDHTIPFSIAQILVPGLAPHAPLAVAFGQVALYLVAAVTASFYLRKRIGQRAWRAFHYVTFVAFAGITIHGIASGSDSNAPWAEAIYIASTVLVLFLLTYRIGMSMAARSAARPGSGGRADGDAYPRGGGRVDAFPGAAQRAAAIADVRAGGLYLPVSEDAPGARPMGGSRLPSMRDTASLRRTAGG